MALRVWGRTTDELGNKTWVAVTTDANGFNDLVYATNLIQVMKLNLGESPFFGNYGIPAKQSVVTQVAPDFYMMRTQRQFASKFASLIIYRQTQQFEPTYQVNVITRVGVVLNASVPVPV
jgi:hypothetical protein